MTRAQQDLQLAEQRVSAVEGDAEVRKIYGGLCHSFPILVRTCGLCQALAFSKDKSTATGGEPKPRNRAHARLLEDVACLLRVEGGDPVAAVRTADTTTYMLHTRRVLGAWIYFKRFAVSILKVQPGEDRDGD